MRHSPSDAHTSAHLRCDTHRQQTIARQRRENDITLALLRAGVPSAPVLATRSLSDLLALAEQHRVPLPSETTESAAGSAEQHYVAYRCPSGTYNSMATMSFGGSEGVIKGFFHHEGEYELAPLAVYFLFTFFVRIVLCTGLA